MNKERKGCLPRIENTWMIGAHMVIAGSIIICSSPGELDHILAGVSVALAGVGVFAHQVRAEKNDS